MKIVAIVLIILGVLILVYQGFSYSTTEEVADIGPIEISQEKEETIPLPPLLGAAFLVLGIVLIFMRGGR